MSSGKPRPRRRVTSPLTADHILARVEAIEWIDVEDPEVQARSPRVQLPNLVTGDEAMRQAAYTSLSSELYRVLAHERERLDNAFATARILSDLIRVPDHPARPLAMILLRGALAGDMMETLRRQGSMTGRVFEIVSAAADDLLAGLEDPCARVRSCSAELLASLPSPRLAARTIHALTRAARVESEPWCQATMMLALGMVVDRSEALSEKEMARWAVADSLPGRVFPWLASLCSDPERELTAAELTSSRREALLQLLRAPDPPLELFPCSRGHIEGVLSSAFGHRGERAALFAAGVLAQAASEDLERAWRCAIGALHLGFKFHPDTAMRPEQLNAEQRQIVALLSERDYPGVPFTAYGLPAGAAGRRQLLSR